MFARIMEFALRLERVLPGAAHRRRRSARRERRLRRPGRYPDLFPMKQRRGRPVRLHELLGGVDVLGWVGDRGVEVTAITHDSRRAVRGGCFACIPGAVTDGHLHAGRGRRRRRHGAARRARARPARHASPGRRRPRRARPRGRRVLRPSVPAAALPRRDGDERQDHRHVPARGDRPGRGPARGPDRDGRRARRRRAPAPRANDARGRRPPGAPRPHARRGRAHGRARGLVARARSASRRRDVVRRRVLHEPEPGPPRLPRLDGVVLRGQGAPVRPDPHCGRGRQRRRPERAGDRPPRERRRAARAHVRRLRRTAAARPSTSSPRTWS